MIEQDDIKISEVLRMLAKWGSEKHDGFLLCSGITCRHDRARIAIVEISNAVAAIQEGKEKVRS